MRDDNSQKGRAISKAIRDGTADLTATVNSLIERETVAADAVGADGRSKGTTGDGDDVQVLEPYGFAAVPPGASTTLVLAPGGDTSNRVALALVSEAGRPATAAGDAAVWTAAGHSILLDDDGGITVTSKDGTIIDLDDAGAIAVTAGGTGSITLTAGTGANVTVNVDGGAVANIGGPAALSLLKAAATEAFLIGAANAVVGTPDVVAGFSSFAGFLLGLDSAAETAKARGE